LNAPLRWTNLAEVVQRSFRQREISPGVMEVEMFGHEIRLENHSDRPITYHCCKRESDPSVIKSLQVAGQPLSWTAKAGYIAFDVKLNPGEKKNVLVTFSESTDAAFAGENLRYRIKAMVRRYLCEIRDNYMMRKSFSQ
jgi:hypothetical protein